MSQTLVVNAEEFSAMQEAIRQLIPLQETVRRLTEMIESVTTDPPTFAPTISPTTYTPTLSPTYSVMPTESPSYNLLKLNSGDTAWMLISSALVLMMTVPGLAIYYGGMVNVRNVLATAMQSLSITCLITVLWLFFGYSLSFAPIDQIRNSGNDKVYVIGDASRMWFGAMDIYSFHQLAPSIPETVYCMFQLTFAIITPALICGSFAGRLKYTSMMVFMAIWHVLVYCPIAHANWHPEGFLRRIGVIDYAGGNVVHISSGIAGLVSTIVLGVRQGFGTEAFEPHNILLTFMGASLIWVGWYGFNAGSAGAANAIAGYAMINTQISTATAGLTWMITEWIVTKQPKLLGMVSGTIAGLVAITPACGWVDTTGAFVIGFVAGPMCYGGAQLKKYLGYDDALDAFGVHAIGGIVGGLMTGLFARSEVAGNIFINGPDNGKPLNGAFYGKGSTSSRMQFVVQMYGCAFSIGWSGVVSYIILKAIDLTMGLRVSAKDELEGLDASIHGESVIDTLSGSAHNPVPNNKKVFVEPIKEASV